MADWIRACATGDIDEQDVVRWDHGGSTYAIYRTGDTYYCTDGFCTHRDEHLEGGLLMGYVIECPLHQGRFDIRSGEVVSPPPCVGLKTYPVKTGNGQVFVRV